MFTKLSVARDLKYFFSLICAWHGFSACTHKSHMTQCVEITILPAACGKKTIFQEKQNARKTEISKAALDFSQGRRSQDSYQSPMIKPP